MIKYQETTTGYEVVELAGIVKFDDTRQIPYRAEKGCQVQYFKTLREALDWIAPHVTNKWSK